MNMGKIPPTDGVYLFYCYYYCMLSHAQYIGRWAAATTAVAAPVPALALSEKELANKGKPSGKNSN